MKFSDFSMTWFALVCFYQSFVYEGSEAELITQPTSQTVSVGSSVTLPCSTNITGAVLLWLRRNCIGDGNTNNCQSSDYIFDGFILAPGVDASRYSVTPGPTVRDLTINPVTAADNGPKICVERAGGVIRDTSDLDGSQLIVQSVPLESTTDTVPQSGLTSTSTTPGHGPPQCVTDKTCQCNSSTVCDWTMAETVLSPVQLSTSSVSVAVVIFAAMTEKAHVYPLLLTLNAIDTCLSLGHVVGAAVTTDAINSDPELVCYCNMDAEGQTQTRRLQTGTLVLHSIATCLSVASIVALVWKQNDGTVLIVVGVLGAAVAVGSLVTAIWSTVIAEDFLRDLCSVCYEVWGFEVLLISFFVSLVVVAAAVILVIRFLLRPAKVISVTST